MKILKLAVTLMSLAIAGLGILGVLAPSVLLEIAGSLLTPPALYWIAALRVVFGALLISVATESRLPRTLRVIGVFIVIAGLLTPLIGSERFAEFLTRFSGQAPIVIRVVAVVPFLVGAFFVYAIHSRRRGTA